MRQIGTISDQAMAKALADHLLTQSIETQLMQDSAGWEVWVRDEDRVEKAKEELAAFLANPSDPRFTNASRNADNIRRAEHRADETYRKRQVDLNRVMRRPMFGVQPVTTALLSICVAVAIFTRMASSESWLSQALFITPFRTADGSIYFHGLAPLRSGQVWRLVTPALLHYDFLHLAGNMLWLYYLGSQIEFRRGSLRFIAMVLAVAAVSNLAQYALGGMTWRDGQLSFPHNPNFGGMSGVVFGLFGYTWMKMRFEPEAGLTLSQQAFVLSILWLVFCFTGLAGSVANAAHLSGLLSGMLLGVAPGIWKSPRR